MEFAFLFGGQNGTWWTLAFILLDVHIPPYNEALKSVCEINELISLI
jgi:hypothetical protein